MGRRYSNMPRPAHVLVALAVGSVQYAHAHDACVCGTMAFNEDPRALQFSLTGGAAMGANALQHGTGGSTLDTINMDTCGTDNAFVSCSLDGDRGTNFYNGFVTFGSAFTVATRDNAGMTIQCMVSCLIDPRGHSWYTQLVNINTACADGLSTGQNFGALTLIQFPGSQCPTPRTQQEDDPTEDNNVGRASAGEASVDGGAGASGSALAIGLTVVVVAVIVVAMVAVKRMRRRARAVDLSQFDESSIWSESIGGQMGAAAGNITMMRELEWDDGDFEKLSVGSRVMEPTF
eukprot:m.177171 g.177171  ORF g.177171 m.177171 type:complete len:290 (+) comp14301_c0_seq1:76-945(+)